MSAIIWIVLAPHRLDQFAPGLFGPKLRQVFPTPERRR
jgi:hypothetical protein